MEDELLEGAEGAIRVLTLNRPEKRNALSISLRGSLAQALDRAGADHEVKAVVLAGTGTAFCAGMDRSQFGTDPRGLFDSTVGMFRALDRFPKPLVAAVQGPAMGGGFYLALSADLRVGCPATVFGSPEITFGVPPSWAFLRAYLGEARARDVGLLGRTIDAQGAHSSGLLSDVVGGPDKVRPAAVAVAERVLSNPEPGWRLFKELARSDRERRLWPALDDEMEAFRRGLGLD